MKAEQVGWFLRRWWWLVLLGGVAAGVLSVAIPTRSSESYSSEGSFIVRPEVADESNLVRATATLIRNPEIVATVAKVARSDLIVDRARQRLDQAGRDGSDAEATSFVVPDTNVVVIGARSENADTAREMAIAMGEEAEAYFAEDDGLYKLAAIDVPAVAVGDGGRESAPLAVFAVVAGLALGLGLALLAERRYPTSPSRRRLRAIGDPRSGAFTKRYLSIRFREEVARSRAGDHMFSLGVLSVVRGRRSNSDGEEHEPAPLRDSDLAAVTSSIEPTLQDHDIFAYLGRSQFAAILPNIDRDEADTLLQEWRMAATHALLRDRAGRALVVTVAACAYESSSCIGDRDAELVAREL